MKLPPSAFPDPVCAPVDGPLARGGELTPERLLDAYRHGIFPWFENDRDPVLWWSPDPRAVLAPDRLRISKSLRKRLKSWRFRVTAARQATGHLDHAAHGARLPGAVRARLRLGAGVL